MPLDAIEFFDGAAVEALGLGLVAEEQRPTVGVFDHAMESFAQGVGAVLAAGDFDISIAGQGSAHGGPWGLIVIEGLIHAYGEESGFEARGAENGLLGQRHAFEGELFLGVFRTIDVDEVLGEMGDFVEVLDADDGEGGGCEAVGAGVLGRAGFALGRARTRALRRVGAIGGELFIGYRHANVLFDFHCFRFSLLSIHS